MLRSSDKSLQVAHGLEEVVYGPARLGLDDRGNGVTAPYTGWSCGPGFRGTLTGLNWPAANRALFFPFRVPVPVTVCKGIAGAGSTGLGNFDIGVYDALGNLIVSSGSVARVVNSENVANFTNTLLAPGMYYMAMAQDGTNQWAAINPGIGRIQYMGARQMASAFPLPSTATFATISSSFVPWFCISYSDD